jgi:hypothetical protein
MKVFLLDILNPTFVVNSTIMTTIDQLKDLRNRLVALRRYL